MFDLDNQNNARETSRTTPSQTESDNDTFSGMPRPTSKRTALVIGIVAIVVVAFLGTLGAVGFYIFRSSSSNQSSTGATAKEAKTKLEAFQGKAGTVLVKSYSEVGSVGGQTGGVVNINAMEFQDRSNGTKASGLGIDVKPSGELAHESHSFIDHDEIDSLLKGIDYINGVTAPTPPLKSFEAHYRTRGDFAIITFNQSDGKIAVAVTGSSISSNDVFLTPENLAALRNHVISAKKILDALDK